MNKKFISLCLVLILLAAVFVAISIFPKNNQPVYYGEEQIVFPAPQTSPLEQKPFWISLFSKLYPFIILGAFAAIAVYWAKKHFSTVKKHLPKAVCVLLCIACIGSSVQLAGTLADTSFTPISPSDYYGRKQLEKMANSSSLLFAYDQMVEGIENHATEISVKNTFHSIDKDEWDIVLYTYLYDYPQHFWMGTSYRYSYYNGSNGDIIMNTILPKYVFTAGELGAARERFNQEANEILSTLSPSMGEYELELALHDILCSRVVYKEVDHAHTAYGGLVTGYAVCEGYGKAFQYLLNQVGIHSTLATGTGTPSSGVTENHAWNFVTINGKNYFVDVTWDDQSEPYYGYFNITTAMLEEDHDLASYPYPFPECTATDDNYFFKNGKAISSFSADKIADLLQYNLTTHIYLTGSTATFNNTLLNNSHLILEQLNMVTSSGISISSLGRERVLTVNGHRRGDLNSDNIVDQNDLALLQQYIEDKSVLTDTNCKKAADYNNDGKVDEKDAAKLSNYIQGRPDEPDTVSSTPASSQTPVSSVPSSSQTVSSHPVSSAPSSNTEPSQPQISSVTPVESQTSSTSESNTSSLPDEPSLALGDVNGDQKINAKDALVVLRVAVNKHTPSMEEFTAADVNKDGTVSAKDALEILKKSVDKPACF